MPSCVTLKNASKSFSGDQHVLDNIDFSVEQGSVMCIIGPSGVGKSTLLRCLTTLETLDRGELAYGDVAVCKDDGVRAVYEDKKTLEAARKKFGMVFQNFNLFPHYSVLKNVAEPLTIAKGMSFEEACEIAKKHIKSLDLCGKEDMVPGDLSGGQQQRVAIARALALSPEVIYFDEPTSALDPRLSREVAKILEEISGEGIATVVVTHDMAFAKTVADRVAIMHAGKFVESGDSEQIFNDPTHEITKEFIATDLL